MKYTIRFQWEYNSHLWEVWVGAESCGILCDEKIILMNASTSDIISELRMLDVKYPPQLEQILYI